MSEARDLLVRNLVALVVMLARRLPKEDPRRERARAFLVRNNLMPSPARWRAVLVDGEEGEGWQK
jgi:hypothetical protein